VVELGESMKIKRQIITDLEALTPDEILSVYSIVAAMKRKKAPAVSPASSKEPSYLRVRKALSGCRGSIADDILSAREDRA
jgi:hypothetical protein